LFEGGLRQGGVWGRGDKHVGKNRGWFQGKQGGKKKTKRTKKSPVGKVIGRRGKGKGITFTGTKSRKKKREGGAGWTGKVEVGGVEKMTFFQRKRKK